MRKTLIPRESSPSIQNLINQKYQLLKQIGAGGFSKVYLGINVESNKLLALKTQKIMAKSVVEREGKILADILKKKNVLGIPKLYWHGSNNGSHFIALELLGPNLETLWKACNKRFSLKTVLMIGDQMLTRLEFLHKQGYVHGDLKPSNFTIGRKHTKDVIYLIDYGLCKLFWNKKTDTHKPYREGQPFQGNTTFASINSHLGIEITRRDDLESLMYVLIYFYKGGFSWDDLDLMEKPQRCARLVDMKTSLPIEILCKGMPEQFMRCLAYCRALQYDEKPDYKYIRNLIVQAMQKKECKNDLEFDWFINEKAQQEIDEETIKEIRHSRERGASSQNFTNIITTNFTTEMSEETFHFVGYSTFVNKTVDDPYMGDENEDPGEEEGIPISNYHDPSTSEVVMSFPSKACIMPASCALAPSNNTLALLKLSKSERQLSRPIDISPEDTEHKDQEAKVKSTGQFRCICNTSGENQIEQQEISSVIFEKKSIDSSCWRICK